MLASSYSIPSSPCTEADPWIPEAQSLGEADVQYPQLPEAPGG